MTDNSWWGRERAAWQEERGGGGEKRRVSGKEKKEKGQHSKAFPMKQSKVAGKKKRLVQGNLR